MAKKAAGKTARKSKKKVAKRSAKKVSKRIAKKSAKRTSKKAAKKATRKVAKKAPVSRKKAAVSKKKRTVSKKTAKKKTAKKTAKKAASKKATAKKAAKKSAKKAPRKTTKKATSTRGPKKSTAKKVSPKSTVRKKPASKEPAAKPVVLEPLPSGPTVGERAPEIELLDQSGASHSLASLSGAPFVLFFYPKDMTSGCTDEACQFRDAMPDFGGVGVRVLGISILDAKSKSKFAEKHGLGYPLLADDATNSDGKPNPRVAKAYGVWQPKSMYGRQYMGINRTTFLVDAGGTVVGRWDNVKVPGHAAEILGVLRAM